MKVKFGLILGAEAAEMLEHDVFSQLCSARGADRSVISSTQKSPNHQNSAICVTEELLSQMGYNTPQILYCRE